MKIIKRQEVIDNVPAHWKSVYQLGNGEWRYGDDKRLIYEILVAAQRSGNFTKATIEDIIGNDSWTRLKCNECECDVDTIIQLGDEPDYESNTVLICKSCLEKALNKINKE